MTPFANRVGIIGAGNIGSVVAKLTVNAGIEVFVSNSRGPESLSGLVAALGPRARAGAVGDVADQSDLLVVAIPFARYQDLPAEQFKGKIVIDATNYIPFRDTAIGELLVGGMTPAQLLQRHLGIATVVKAFSNIYSGHLEALARPHGATDRSALPIAGDDVSAKAVVQGFLDRLGWDAVDAGNLQNSALFDVGSPAFVKAYLADASGDPATWGSRLGTDPGRPLGRAQLQALVRSL